MRLASIVDDLTNDTPQITMTLGVIEVAELGRSLVQARVGRYISIVSTRDILDGGVFQGRQWLTAGN